MAQTVTLENRVPRLLTFELAHETVCLKGQCRCTRQIVGWRDHDPKSGTRTVRGERKRVPAVVTLLGKGTPEGGHIVEGLPLAVQRLPSIQAAVRRKDIRLTVVDDGAAPAPEAAHEPTDADAAEAAKE